MTVIRPRVRPAGERSLLLELGSLEEVHQTWRAFRADPPPGLDDVVAGSRTVLLILRSEEERREAEIRLLARQSPPAALGAGRLVTIPVVYDGPDLAETAALTGLSAGDVVRLHADRAYTVSFMGFSPGFAYLVGVDPVLHLPRLATPRRSVPAGSVALAAGMTAVYPQPTPGGWRIIGRSATPMFDPSKAPAPSLLLPGDRVRFLPVDRLDAVHPVGPVGEGGLPEPPGVPYLEVVAPGLATTVQDGGRPGWAHLGVPTAGAADRAAAERANCLVGNPPDAAVLETLMHGLQVRVGADRRVALTGALVDLTVDGLPGCPDRALHLRSGSELAVRSCRAGLRSYLAVEGGIIGTTVLGSRSTDTLSGLGPRPVRSGDRLLIGPPAAVRLVAGSAGEADPGGCWAGPAGRPPPPGPAGAVVLRARRGPRDDWVGPLGLRILGTAEFTVTPSSDRVGVRLCGPPVTVEASEQLPTEGLVPGSVEIPPDGQPIVLMRNHPTTGGYPVAAVVEEADVDVLAQCRPGVRVRFEFV